VTDEAMLAIIIIVFMDLVALRQLRQLAMLIYLELGVERPESRY